MSFQLADHNKNPAASSKYYIGSKSFSRSPFCIDNRLSTDFSRSSIRLQNTIGAQPINKILHSDSRRFDFTKISIQPKLRISLPGDPYEQEADRVAEQVMRTTTQDHIKPLMAKEEEKVERKCMACEMAAKEEEEKSLNLTRKPSNASSLENTAEIENVVDDVISEDSFSLDDNTREFMESRFGFDFATVKIHTDEKASRSAESISALSYAIGDDIIFGRGQYNPNTFEGKRLLAHELAHVIQHRSPSLRKERRMYNMVDNVNETRSVLPSQREVSPLANQHFQHQNHIFLSNTPEKIQREYDGSHSTLSESPMSGEPHKLSSMSCTPSSGLSNTNCSIYLANSWWLPDAYVNNATCACLETPNDPTASCVRKFLQDRLATTPMWFKMIAASQKKALRTINPSAYDIFVQTMLTPRIYNDHVDAYSHCCCPCGPAPYPAWVGVTTVPLPCSAVGWSIRQFGSCHCTPGSW